MKVRGIIYLTTIAVLLVIAESSGVVLATSVQPNYNDPGGTGGDWGYHMIMFTYYVQVLGHKIPCDTEYMNVYSPNGSTDGEFDMWDSYETFWDGVGTQLYYGPERNP